MDSYDNHHLRYFNTVLEYGSSYRYYRLYYLFIWFCLCDVFSTLNAFCQHTLLLLGVPVYQYNRYRYIIISIVEQHFTSSMHAIAVLIVCIEILQYYILSIA